MPRREAADSAAALGCKIASGITRKTTMLVVEDQDIKRLGGYKKSSKHRKAEEFINKGLSVRILRAGDSRELVKFLSEMV